MYFAYKLHNMILNLDKTFNPLPRKKELGFELFTFSGGEPHIKLSTEHFPLNEVTISHRIQSFNHLGELLVACNALKKAGVQKIHLILPYFPGARQDRLMIPGEPLTVKVYAELINQLKLDSVSILDPHSEVTPALLDRCIAIDNHLYIEQVLDTLSKNTLLISPDGGALKKIYKLASHVQDYDVIECSKVRDVKSGHLSGFKVYAEDLNQQDCLIVDDICDGGGTFIGLAQELKAKNAGKLYLAVSHGIFNKGLEELKKHFSLIFTTNSFKDHPKDEQLIQIPFSKILK